MQAVTDQFKAAVNAATRHLDVMLTVLNRSGTERVYTSNDALLSLKIVDGKTTGGFGLGGTICPSLTAELHKSAVVAVNDKITVQIIVKDGGNLTLAREFSVDDIKRRPDGTMQVTALGLMIKLGKNHVSSITYPATQYQLLSEIAARAGTQLHPTLESRLINNPTIESAPIKGTAEDGTTLYYTRRELLGYAAAINGGSAIIDQYGYLDIGRYTDTGEVIGADRAFREDITDSYEITDVQWNTTGLSYALDDDFENGMVEFYNPLDYADSERDTIISNLDSELVGFNYEGAVIQKQGCGYFQVGDIVTYKDIGGVNHTLLIMSIVYSFSDGYFTETLYSLANSENRRQYAGQEKLPAKNETSEKKEEISIEQAVIIQQNDLTKFIDKYEVIKYIHGNRVVYTAGTGGIVCGGYLWRGLLNAANPALDYSKIVTPSGDVYELVLDYVSYSTTYNKYEYRFPVLLNGEQKKAAIASYGDVGLGLKWTRIDKPNELHPYGWATGQMWYCYTKADGTLTADTSVIALTMDFLSEAEYNAAVGLTYDYDVNEDNLVDAGDGS